MANSSDLDVETLLALNRSVIVARLLSGAVHAVNNALQVIVGTVELFKGRTGATESMADVFARVSSQTTRAYGALERMLAFARGVAESPAPVDLCQVAAGCVSLCECAIRRAGHTLTMATKGPVLVMACRQDLEQALLNLLLHAEHAIAGTRGTVDVEVSAVNGRAAVRVAHSGVARAVEEELRNPFAASFDSHKGVVMALWAARVLVERAGGSVGVESTRGAALVISLPLVPPVDVPHVGLPPRPA